MCQDVLQYLGNYHAEYFALDLETYWNPVRCFQCEWHMTEVLSFAIIHEASLSVAVSVWFSKITNVEHFLSILSVAEEIFMKRNKCISWLHQIVFKECQWDLWCKKSHMKFLAWKVPLIMTIQMLWESWCNYANGFLLPEHYF